jgi:hypothetical protein
MRNILSEERIDLSLMNMLGICQVYISNIQHVIENSSSHKIQESNVSPGFAEIMSILLVLCYNGSLIT